MNNDVSGIMLLCYRLLLIAAASALASVAAAEESVATRVPASIAAPEDGNWPMPAKNYASTRYSGLDEINRQNVSNLKVAFTFSPGTWRGQESAPVVVNGTLYFVSAFPNILYALDLTKPGAPMKWKYEPKPAAAA
jgi:glucose dehydrogenase